MKVELNITKHEFTTEEGEVKQYYRFVAELGGETVNFIPKPEEKKFANYLLKTYDLPIEKD